MTASVRTVGANSAAAGTSSPAGVAWSAAVAGERMYVILTTLSASAAPVTPAGWTGEKAFTGYSTFFGVAVYSKVAAGGETGIAITLGTPTRWAVAAALISGASTPAPAHTETSRVSPVPATSAALVFPQITPAYDDAFLLELSAVRYESGATPGSVSIPDTNWTKQRDTCTTNAAGAQVGAMIGTRQRAGGNGVQTTAVTALTSPNSLNSNLLFAFPAAVIADPSAVPAGWQGPYNLYKRA
jgi:hypothetical protein